MGLKILFLSHYFYPDIGGIETNSEILAHAFTSQGHQVHLLTWSADDKGKTFPFGVIRSPGLRQLFIEHKWADIVFENNPCLRLSWPIIFFGRPSVIALNTWISRANGRIGIQERVKFLWLKRASKVIAVSNAIRNRCWPPAIVIGNPYREKEFRIIMGALRPYTFVFLGRLVSDKGADIAIRALHKLSNAASVPHTLTIIGKGPDNEKLRLLTKDLGMQSLINFKGALQGQELVECLNLHRFILVPSVWEEPFGNVALEGMACGCLPIVSDGGGLPDAVGKAGLTFRRGDVDDLVSCIRHVLEHPGLEQKIRLAAADHLAIHRAKNVSKIYLDVIREAAKTKTR